MVAEFNLEPLVENRDDGATIVLDVDDPDEAYEHAEEHGADSVLEQRDLGWDDG